MIWTPDQDAALFRLYVTEGYSASQTAAMLPGGARSRNAVIGRAHRLGFAARREPSAPHVKTPYPERPAFKRRRRGHSLAPVIATVAEPCDLASQPNAKPWIDRASGECAYPVGTATGADQLSCCNPCGEAGYCPGHARIMFNGIPIIKPQASRKSRERTFEAWAA